MSIPFIDLQSQRARIADKIDAAISRVLEHGRFILGPEVTEFENALAKFENAEAVIGCANGTDAIILVLRALGIGEGDAVFCPSYTYTASAEAIVLAGATPVFVDIKPGNYTMCEHSLSAAIEDMIAGGRYEPKAVMAVDLFGQPADYPKLLKVTRKYGLPLISDNAQAIGSRRAGKSTIEYADIATTSFFPAKPLGCYGDGGAILLKDRSLEETIRSLAFHGRSKTPYDHDKIGFNSRLDSIQAAVLLEKLKIFEDEIQERGAEAIRAKNLPVAAYYPRPVHEQSAYTDYPVVSSGLTETNRVKKFAAALPMHAYLSEADQDIMIEAVQSA